MSERQIREVLIIGGGLAGLSAALYLGRSRRDTLLVHSNRSMAKWETDVQNYLGFPDGIDGTELLRRGRDQVTRFHVGIVEDEISSLEKIEDGTFSSLRKNSVFAKYGAAISRMAMVPEEPAGCSKRPSSEAAASEEATRTLAVR